VAAAVAEGEVAEADHAEGAGGFVDDDDAGECLGVLLDLAEGVEGLLEGEIDGDAADLGGHASAGGVLLVAEEGAGEFLVVLMEESEEAVAGAVADVLEDVDAVVVGGGLEDLALLGGFEVVEGFLDEFFGEFGEEFGEAFGAEGAEEEAAVVLVVELLVNGGEVGVVEGFLDFEDGGGVAGGDGFAEDFDCFFDFLGHVAEGRRAVIFEKRNFH